MTENGFQSPEIFLLHVEYAFLQDFQRRAKDLFIFFAVNKFRGGPRTHVIPFILGTAALGLGGGLMVSPHGSGALQAARTDLCPLLTEPTEV